MAKGKKTGGGSWKPCKICGSDFLTEDGRVKICSKACRNKVNAAYQRQYNHKNNDLIKSITSRYYKKYGEECKKRSAEYYHKNKEKGILYARNRRENEKEIILASRRKCYQKNKDKIKESARLYFLKNKESRLNAHKKWLATPNGKQRKYTSNRLRLMRKKAASMYTDITVNYILDLKKKIKNCSTCNVILGSKAGDTQRNLDHIIPLGVGGLHVKNNVRYLCRKCNLARPKDGTDLKNIAFQSIVGTQ